MLFVGMKRIAGEGPVYSLAKVNDCRAVELGDEAHRLQS